MHAPTLAPVPHTQTESTLAPTAEFTRIFLLAWIIRYIFRGAGKAAFEPEVTRPGVAAKIVNALSAPGRWLQQHAFKGSIPLHEWENAAYSASLGLGSGALSLSYASLVRTDIQNLFREAVSYETGKPQEQVTFKDIEHSSNQIVQRTVHNYRRRMWGRLGTDALFFLAAPLRSEGVTDLLLGGKGVQIFADTWKRKTTMFEDLVTFVNNKINPRNGLGQPVSIGELFDLYQHYADIHQPDKMFRNVLSRDTSEQQLHTISQPIFSRMAELMNLTYAYKHYDATPDAVRTADFALPKFIYLLGHNLIDTTQPERTMALVEIMNARGANDVQQTLAAMEHGTSPRQALAHFGLHFPHEQQHVPPVNQEKNGVIAKGSTMQLDAAPSTRIDAAGASTAQLAAMAAHRLQ